MSVLRKGRLGRMPPSEPADRPLTEGERWTREQLEALLAARFGPRAVAHFLAESQRRSNRIRRERPELARQEVAWIGAGAAAWAALALGGAQPFRRGVRAGLAWWAAAALMLDWHLGMLESEDGRPQALGPADALTLLRVWLVPVALDTPSPLVCGTAAASDVLDGIVARATTGPTRAGRDLEGLADICFAVAALRGALRRGTIGHATAASELVRLGAGFGYALWVYFGRAAAPDPAVVRAARVTTPLRAGGLIAAGLGRRRLADGAVLGGSLWSVAAVARAVRSGRRPRAGS